MPTMNEKKTIHTLNDLSAARGELVDTDGVKIPMLRLEITVDRIGSDGRVNGIRWPDLWLEPHTAENFAQAIRSALARLHLGLDQSLGMESPDDRSKPRH